MASKSQKERIRSAAPANDGVSPENGSPVQQAPAESAPPSGEQQKAGSTHSFEATPPPNSGTQQGPQGGPPPPPPTAPVVPAPVPEKLPFIEYYEQLSSNPPDEKAAQATFQKAFSAFLAKHHQVTQEYNVLLFFDDRNVVRSDADKIYRALGSFGDRRPILLVLQSNGGHVSAGYLIGKLCREYAADKFIVAVPREAKSAATLICCGADEIHMGSLSELGPIDPQIEDSPALGLKYAVENLAELAKKYPAASEMFASYLKSSLNLINLGYYERVAESAVQYAERLLGKHAAGLQKTPREIAEHLVYFYKDHGFVIDKDEAESIFGGAMIKSNTDEYKFANAAYQEFSWWQSVSRMCGFSLYQVGSATMECELQKHKK